MFRANRIQAVLRNTLFISSILFGNITQASDADAQAEILHWWSSAGEHAALDVFINEFKARGGHYYDSTTHPPSHSGMQAGMSKSSTTSV